MKVETKHIAEAFNQIGYLLDGISDAIQSGDDGFEETVLSISKDIKTVMTAFSLSYMTPVVTEKKHKHGFLNTYERLHDKKNNREEMTPGENSQLLKAQFYLFLKRKLREVTLPETLDSQVMESFIYENIVAGGLFELYFSTEYVDEVSRILFLVAEEVITELKKHPQLVLFTDSEKPASSNLLIDNLKN